MVEVVKVAFVVANQAHSLAFIRLSSYFNLE